jgi:hypothetical protein
MRINVKNNLNNYDININKHLKLKNVDKVKRAHPSGQAVYGGACFRSHGVSCECCVL